ncbi:MAG TPA: hypothetical protein PK005_08090 [Bacteroidales bacterium]|jgi:hypothetical protein|nr:hypothetical protein [Bacteroidales bacterium]HNV66080.1 hypothetical protein [Bacteroidales bacterium]HOT16930.1 hypothetical protein [Bacteroidales bacterium]HPV26574.1 hypothetical protein [Bacteroidales bacterium]HPX54396.1 hypothetical protein [Bacteroidales bacterium]
MKKSIFILLLPALIGFAGCNDSKSVQTGLSHAIPSLEELSGVWVSTDTVVMEPSIRNFRGQALLNRDMTSISWFVSAPFSGGYHTGTLRVNGKTPGANSWRWQPYQALRKGSIDNLDFLSSTRMLFEKDAVMWEVEITNSDTVTREANLELDLIGFISKFGGDWQWWYPYPSMSGTVTNRNEEVENIREHLGENVFEKEGWAWELVDGKPVLQKVKMRWPGDADIMNSKKFTTNVENNTVYIRDTESQAITSFSVVTGPDRLTGSNCGATASWKYELKPGEKRTIKYLMAYGDNPETIKQNVTDWSAGFDTLFSGIKGSWEEKWDEIFKPGNSLISGCFPILVTDDAVARKVYYTSPLTMLYLINTNLPEHSKVFLTGGPRWGASITFFWDITLWSTLWAVVDPVMMKEHLSSWIKIDPSKYYGKDNFGGKGVGNGYSANYWALFQLIRDYVSVSGDYAYLDETIGDKTVLQHLDDYSMNWKNISLYGTEGCTDDVYRLADFGDDEWNLLECVPTYKHIVPSFNVGYAWMMRETAKLHQHRGEQQKADSLNVLASEMVKRILQLYAGNGVWNSLYPGNKKIEVRHCLDFSFFGKYIPDDIPANIKSEMLGFLYDELMTDHWMRAQSLKDLAADKSDRADHGPFGAFDGWPVDIMDALTQMGFPQQALDFYHAVEPVTYEGIWAQAHELWGENKTNKKALVRIPERDWCNRESSSGVAFAQTMLKDFFGFYPDPDGTAIKASQGFQFEGSMHHVYYQNEYYAIKYRSGKPVMIKEKTRK